MTRFSMTGALLVSALALAACQGGDKAENESAGNAAGAANTAAPATNENGDGAEGATAEAGSRQDFTVLNNSGFTVMTLQVSPVDESQWGPDILGAQVIPNGETAAVTFERGENQCNWDIRVTYDDGDSNELRAVNLCEIGTVTLN